MSYEILRIIWWLLLGVLLGGFAIADGFDLGTAALLTFVGRSDVERRVAINSVGPVWEGNQVWFILGGGAIFAAWPALYAASFSGFYLAMFLVLAALIVRPVGFKFRSKLEDPRWRGWWDWALCIGGIVPPLVFGVAFGNLFEGVPFGFARVWSGWRGDVAAGGHARGGKHYRRSGWRSGGHGTRHRLCPAAVHRPCLGADCEDCVGRAAYCRASLGTLANQAADSRRQVAMLVAALVQTHRGIHSRSR